jgi:DNA-binding NtrC family response regulator
LSTLVIELPSLATRLDDLPLVAQAILEETNAAGYRQLAGFAPEALDQLAAYSWPGNIDELAAVIRETHEKARGSEITVHDLPKRIHWAFDAAAHPPRSEESIVLGDFLDRVERELIARAMRRAKGNKSRAAKLLGLTRPRLYRRLVQLGLEPADPHGAEPKAS